jgi:FkbM family methyltransferase
MTADTGDAGSPTTDRVMFLAEDEAPLVQAFLGGSGYFVDVGANEPVVGSQSYYLEQLGWDGILIEPQPELAAALRGSRKARVYAVACSSPENAGRRMTLKLAGIYSTLNPQFSYAKARSVGEIEVPVKTLDEVLIEAGAPVPIDFLSIDVEGHELDLLRGFDFDRWRPRLVLIEDLVLDRKLHQALKARGYAWMRRTGINSWYVPARLAPRVGLYGRLQFVRKYYVGVPIRRLRETLRRRRSRNGVGAAGHG